MRVILYIAILIAFTKFLPLQGSFLHIMLCIALFEGVKFMVGMSNSSVTVSSDPAPVRQSDNSVKPS